MKLLNIIGLVNGRESTLQTRANLHFSGSNACKRIAKAALLFALSLNVGGCNLIKQTLELPEKSIRSMLSLDKGNNQTDPVELQSQLLRFSDNSINALNLAAGRLQREDDKATQIRSILLRRISTTNDIVAIATGANAYANLLDMVIFATLNRMNVEDYWIPKFFGDSARPYLRAAKDVEKEIWRIAGTVLKKEQISELRAAIEVWHKQHPSTRSPRDLGSMGFASEIAQMNRSTEQQAGITTSVFNLLVIDPLAGLDPATRELANTRLFAERGLFLARYLPTLIRWETELLVIQTGETPKVEQLLSNADRLSAAADRFSRTTERLPGYISAERRQVINALRAQQPELAELAIQAEKTLAAGKAMSDASTITLKAFQDVVRQLQAIPSRPDAEPFRIQEYTIAAAQMAVTVQDLLRLLQILNQTLAPDKFDQLTDIFRQIVVLGLILIGSACALVLVSAVVYWRLRKRFA
jgi:hypothetical protein